MPTVLLEWTLRVSGSSTSDARSIRQVPRVSVRDDECETGEQTQPQLSPETHSPVSTLSLLSSRTQSRRLLALRALRNLKLRSVRRSGSFRFRPQGLLMGPPSELMSGYSYSSMRRRVRSLIRRSTVRHFRWFFYLVSASLFVFRRMLVVANTAFTTIGVASLTFYFLSYTLQFNLRRLSLKDYIVPETNHHQSRDCPSGNIYRGAAAVSAIQFEIPAVPV